MGNKSDCHSTRNIRSGNINVDDVEQRDLDYLSNPLDNHYVIRWRPL